MGSLLGIQPAGLCEWDNGEQSLADMKEQNPIFMPFLTFKEFS
jgi:hypothetical protein